MKIESYEEVGESLKIVTKKDGVFVYPIDKFNNLAALKKEITNKIKEKKDKKAKKDSKKVGLLAELMDDING